MKKHLFIFVIVFFSLMFSNCKHEEDNYCNILNQPTFPCGLSSPNPTYVDAKRVIKTYCVGCHNVDSIGRYLQYDQLNNACNNGTFNRRVFLKRDMPPSNSAQMDTCDYIILRRWFMNGHNPY